MAELSAWLRRQLAARGLTQNQLAVYANIGQATISEMLRKEYVPKVETLFRLADYLGVSREEVLRLAGLLPPLPDGDSAGTLDGDDVLVEALLSEFRRVPDEWKPVVVQQVAQYRRMDELRPRVIGGEPEEEQDEEAAESGEAQAA